MDVRELGSYIREQRQRSRLTLRSLSGAAGVSIPYLSQVERGLRKPSADIVQAIAKGLRVSSETLYVRAGMLEDRSNGDSDVPSAVMADASLTERQKEALLQIYRTFRDGPEATSSGPAARATPAPQNRPRKTVRAKPASGSGSKRVGPAAVRSTTGARTTRSSTKARTTSSTDHEEE